jgi:hypothetical protein
MVVTGLHTTWFSTFQESHEMPLTMWLKAKEKEQSLAASNVRPGQLRKFQSRNGMQQLACSFTNGNQVSLEVVPR